MSDNILSIYEAIPKIMDEIGPVGKNKRNEQGKFMYRGIDDVMNVLNPAMAKNGVFVVPEVIRSEYLTRATNKGGTVNVAILTVRFSFFAKDGTYVTATTMGEAMDSGDKASNKAMAVALKYACFQTFMIPTEEMTQEDPDGYGLQEGECSYPLGSQSSKKESIKCDRCGQKVALGNSFQAINNDTGESAMLCEKCAREVGII